MYEKNLTEDFRLGLSKKDMDFLRSLSESRSQSVSECVRSIIGEYRRSLDTIDILKAALDLDKRREAVRGDTKTDLDDLV